MAILVDKNTKIMVQGITGTQASFHIQRAIKYGTNIVAGVVPNKTDKTYLGVPLFNTVEEAKEKTGADASVIFVPAKYAKNAVLEAIKAKLQLIVIITTGIPVNDMLEIRHELAKSQTILIGPNTPGIITPQEAYMGIFPDNIHKSGNIGIISRSSTLTYEAVLEINKVGLGESTIIGLGDDFIIGAGYYELIKKFGEDKKTKAIVMISGIGGNYEIEAAHIFKQHKINKPVIVLLIEDKTPLSNNTSLASEILCRGVTSVTEKRQQLEAAGMIVAESMSELTAELLKI